MREALAYHVSLAMHGIMGMKRCMRTCGAAATTAAGTQHRGADAEREQGVGRAVARQASGIPSRSMATILQREGGEKVGRILVVPVFDPGAPLPCWI